MVMAGWHTSMRIDRSRHRARILRDIRRADANVCLVATPLAKRRIALGAAGVFGLIWLAVWYVLPWCVPLPAALMQRPQPSPVITDRHGEPLARLVLPGFIRSAPIAIDAIPADLAACTIAAEDKRFRRHGGVDLLATCRALRDAMSGGRVVSGASTITQQLVKISSPPAERTIARKAFEALAARRLEMSHTKDEILCAYLNRLDYGNLRIGAAEAAAFYLQKPLADLSLAESALLAGLPQAPSRLNPLRHPQRAQARRDAVLSRLAAMRGADPARLRIATAEPVVLRPLQPKTAAPWIAHGLPRITATPTTNQPVVRTTIDRSLQLDIEAIVREETARLHHTNLRHAAVVAIDNATREVLALVSSADWQDARGGQINGAWIPRSPGSALKPFTYLLAIESMGRTPASIVADVPTPYLTPQGLDLPQNHDRRFRGPVTLRDALACSLNVPALRELDALGGPAPLHGLLERLGLHTLGDRPEHHGLGLTLGNAPVRLLELTNAFATIACNGHHTPPALIAEPSAAREEPPLWSATASWWIADILSDRAARAPTFAPGGPLDTPFHCAVKTGTSSDFRDNWCVGFTPEFTVGVWAGNFEHQPMKQVSGVDGAGPIFRRSIERLHRDLPPSWFACPEEMARVRIDPRNGKRLAADAKVAVTREESIPAARMPPLAQPADYDASGRAWLDAAYTSWHDGPHNERRHEVVLDPSASRIEPLRVITPADGTTYLLDPDMPSGSDRLRPVTNLPGVAHWSSPTLHIEPSAPEPVIHLTPGTHTLTATDPRNGSVRSITVHVRRI